MVRIAIAALAAITLAGAPALAGTPWRAPAKPSSFAPQPSSGPHVYGAPIGPATVGSAAVRRKHASPKHPLKHPPKVAARHAKATAPKPPPPPVYAAPDPS